MNQEPALIIGHLEDVFMEESWLFYFGGLSAMAALAAEPLISSFIGSGEFTSLILGAAHD